MLAVQLQIGFRDAFRVRHVVVNGCSRSPVSARAVFLRPPDRGVNRHICSVDATRVCRTGLSGFLAAMPTPIPLFANSLAQLELIPGPPPTMSATSRMEDCGPWLSDWVMCGAPMSFRKSARMPSVANATPIGSARRPVCGPTVSDRRRRAPRSARRPSSRQWPAPRLRTCGGSASGRQSVS
jgi:hypothetical protein